MYRYDNYTDSFVRIDGEPNTGSTTVRVGVPLEETATIVKKVELTDECIDNITDAIVMKLADRKGKWMEREVLEDTVINEWQSARCSKCGKYHTTPYMYYFDDFNYCPNCGAKMNGEREE